MALKYHYRTPYSEPICKILLKKEMTMMLYWKADIQEKVHV